MSRHPDPNAAHRHALYRTWESMLARCYRSTHRSFPIYGGRGIYVCDRWRHDFWAFVADVGPRPEGHELDRIDNDGPYRPGNVRWVTRSTQARNRRPRRGALANGARLTNEQVAEARDRRSRGESYASIGRSLGCSGENIRLICARTTWQ